MQLGRVVGACAASLAVAGCAVVVVAMGRSGDRPVADPSSSAPTVAHRPAELPMSRAVGSAALPSTPSVGISSVTSAATIAARSSAPATHQSSTRGTPATTHPAPAAQPAPHASSAARGPVSSGQRLPLGYGTGSATEVITVTAGSTGSTTATLQAWTKVTGGWRAYGSAVTAHVGSDGLSTHASESRSATPIGSFTLTQAFGYYSDPGTALPYFKTTPSDYWISDSGANYNTHQRCSSCGYNDGVNERLYYETPYYNYAVVIDYNTRNAPGGVRQGAGSAFFLHVTDGRATAGCVAIPQTTLVGLMRWLTPSAHPRILIGVR